MLPDRAPKEQKRIEWEKNTEFNEKVAIQVIISQHQSTSTWENPKRKRHADIREWPEQRKRIHANQEIENQVRIGGSKHLNDPFCAPLTRSISKKIEKRACRKKRTEDDGMREPYEKIDSKQPEYPVFAIGETGQHDQPTRPEEWPRKRLTIMKRYGGSRY
nr:hypothetical protein [Desulfobulbus rhabdoformis]